MSIKVKIDNDYVVFPDQQPRLVNGSTLVPVFPVFNHLGYDVHWEPGRGSAPKGTLVLTNNYNTIKIKEFEKTFTVNGRIFFHPDNVSAQIIGGRVMIPIRRVLERIGYFVGWDATTKTVIVSTMFNPSVNTTYKIAAKSGQAIGNEQSVKYLSLPSVAVNNRNVFIHDSVLSNLWQVIDAGGGYLKILTCSNTDFGLNYFYSNGLGNPGNCDVYPHSDNDDSIVEFLNDGDNPQLPIGRIKLVRDGTDLYLTANGVSNGANVSWQPYADSDNQIWKFIEANNNVSSLRKTIDLPEDRTYNWYQLCDEIVGTIKSEYGCTWTCGLDIANIYGPSEYKPEHMLNAWLFGVVINGYYQMTVTVVLLGLM